MSEISREDVNKLMEKLHRERAVDFRGYKPSSLGRRIQRRLDATECPDIESYVRFLDKRPDEYTKLIDSILINVTEFFREPEAWEVLRSEVIPQILANKKPGDQIRMWSAGCASGEEPYSLAISLAQALGSAASEYDVRIYATDIDDHALAIARKAEYPDEAVEKVPGDLLERYFTKNGRWAVSRNIRKTVLFGQHNLVTDPPISHLDLIVCRNVLIYMTVELQNRVLNRFHYSLDPQGFIFLGKAESLLSASHVFRPANERWRIFRKESPLTDSEQGHLDQQAVRQAADAGRAEYQQASAFNEAILRYSSSGIIALDNTDVVRLVNQAAETLWGIQAADLLGKTLLDAQLQPALRELLPEIVRSRSQRRELTGCCRTRLTLRLSPLAGRNVEPAP